MCRCEWLFGQLLQLAFHQTEAALHVVGITTEVDIPVARIGIGVEVGIDAVDQAVALTHHHVEAGVHPGTAQQVVEQNQCEAARVVAPESRGAHHDVGLMGVLLHDACGWCGVAFESRGSGHLSGAYFRGRWGRSRHFGLMRLGEQTQHAGKVGLPIDKEDGIVRSVVAVGKSVCIGRGVLAQTFGSAENVAPKGSVGKEEVFEFVENEF